ncbi:uncharacterized protein FFB14_15258 [Fusarium fujikuroi]|nr:uncharacterized protein FFB14_15258 [Fusarium fujikuroi]
MEPDDHEPPSSSSSLASSLASSSDVCCLPSPSSLKSTATSSRKVSPPPELKCETKQSPAPESAAPESPAHPSPGTSRLRLPEALADFKRKADAGAGGAGPWTVLPLSNEDHTNYLEQIEATFRRFDYDPRNGRIAIRMPGIVHEIFIRLFDYHLLTLLNSVGRKHHKTATGDFIDKIVSLGSADIGLNPKSPNAPNQCMATTKNLTRSPDAQFALVDAGLSGVVVEVAYSQDGKKLPGLARDYILRSHGKIKVVIGFDINRDNMPSTISVYKVRKTRSDTGRLRLEAEPVIFRNPDNTPASGELTLSLHDFADDDRCENVDDLRLSIPHSELSNILGKAEMRLSQKNTGWDEDESVDWQSTSASSNPDEDPHPEDKT